MSEQETTEEKKPEEPVSDADEGSESKTVTDLDRAEEINTVKARICEREEKILDRKEALKAREMVGGTSEAGMEKPKEETPAEYAKKVAAGEI